MTSPGRSRLYKHRLQSKIWMNSLLLTIGPATGVQSLNGLITLNGSVASCQKQIEIIITATILSTLNTVCRCAFAF